MTGIFEGIDSFARGLNFHLVRQNAVSANIANVDTPGYAPKELIRPERSSGSGFSINLAETDVKHISAPSNADAADFDIVEERNEIAGNDLNFVSLEHEMSRLAANTLRYQAITKIITKRLGIMHYAARDGR